MTTLPSSSSKVNLNDIVVPSARNASFNSQYNFKVITLFYLFRVGQRYSITKTGKHYRFRFQSVYKYQPCSLRSQLS